MRSTVLRRTTLIGALVGVLAAAGIAVAASNTTVSTHNTSRGKALATSKGFSLYMFAKDKQGGKGKTAKSNCYGNCAKVWPPLLVSNGGKVVAARASGVNSKLLGTTRRRDGKLEVTYNGWPLYTYVTDRRPGQSTGEAINQFGAAWYLLNTRGAIVCQKGFSPSPSDPATCLSQSY